MHDWPIATPTPTVCTCGAREGALVGDASDGTHGAAAWRAQGCCPAQPKAGPAATQPAGRPQASGTPNAASLGRPAPGRQATGTRAGADLVLDEAHGVVDRGALGLKAHRLAVGARGACRRGGRRGAAPRSGDRLAGGAGGAARLPPATAAFPAWRLQGQPLRPPRRPRHRTSSQHGSTYPESAQPAPAAAAPARTRGVDVKVHGLGAVLVLQVQHLRDDQLRDGGHQLRYRADGWQREGEAGGRRGGGQPRRRSGARCWHALLRWRIRTLDQQRTGMPRYTMRESSSREGRSGGGVRGLWSSPAEAAAAGAPPRACTSTSCAEGGVHSCWKRCRSPTSAAAGVPAAGGAWAEGQRRGRPTPASRRQGAAAASGGGATPPTARARGCGA